MQAEIQDYESLTIKGKDNAGEFFGKVRDGSIQLRELARLVPAQIKDQEEVAILELLNYLSYDEKASHKIIAVLKMAGQLQDLEFN